LPASTAKTWRHGTHRTVAPAATVERVRPMLAAMGITRVANVTGLDRLGLPVVTVCRPNGRSLSVAQGKGLTLDAAKASGLMESIEMWHAEHLALEVQEASAERIGPALDPLRLPRPERSRWRSDVPIPWVMGRELVSGRPVAVPQELVTLDCRQPWPEGFGCFQISTNGLASGNEPAEAMAHGLAELIERDAVTLWQQRDPFAKAETRLDPGTVDDPDAVLLIERLAAAGMAMAIWEVTSDVGVPAFLCHLMDADLGAHDGLGWSTGGGCHPDPGIALVRAVTEAAQARLTHIVGSRDDIGWRYYAPVEDERLRRHHALLTGQPGARAFDAASGCAGATFAADLEAIASRLAAAGVGPAVIVDLTWPEFGLPVVKTIVAGLEDGIEVPGWRPGPRARAARQGRLGVVA
jgi:ribosomal protein S12 methylthiotransferase accessory factor